MPRYHHWIGGKGRNAETSGYGGGCNAVTSPAAFNENQQTGRAGVKQHQYIPVAGNSGEGAGCSYRNGCLPKCGRLEGVAEHD